jgi:hypothetical protein
MLEIGVFHNGASSLPVITTKEGAPSTTGHGRGPQGRAGDAGAPPKATMLFPVSLPSRGGDTRYVDMHEAYDVSRRRPESASTGSRRCMFI